MVKVQWTLSRSKGQAGELGSNLGERPEIAQPVLQRGNLCRMGIHLTCRCIWRKCRSSETRCNTSRMFSSDHACGMHINQSGCAVNGKQRVVYRGPHQCRICPASSVIEHGCIPSDNIWNDYHCFSCWIFLYWVDRYQWVSESKTAKIIHPTGEHWVEWWDGASTASVSHCACREREVGALIYACIYLVTSTVLGNLLGMSQKCNIFTSKQKHRFSQVLLSASIKLLSETQFYLSISKLYLLARMDWDGSHFLLNVWVN